jgi:hypothetical protein
LLIVSDCLFGGYTPLGDPAASWYSWPIRSFQGYLQFAQYLSLKEWGGSKPGKGQLIFDGDKKSVARLSLEGK